MSKIYTSSQQLIGNTPLLELNRFSKEKQLCAKVLAKLEVLEKLFVKDSNKWEMYASLMGNTVTQVVNRRDELVAAGCNAKDIHAAGEATEKLRRLMKGYFALRGAQYASEHEKITALYSYYTQNYTALRD